MHDFLIDTYIQILASYKPESKITSLDVLFPPDITAILILPEGHIFKFNKTSGENEAMLQFPDQDIEAVEIEFQKFIEEQLNADGTVKEVPIKETPKIISNEDNIIPVDFKRKNNQLH